MVLVRLVVESTLQKISGDESVDPVLEGKRISLNFVFTRHS